jgi:ATP synthase protein I
VFAGLSRSGLLDDTLDRAWLAGVVIAGTFGWLLTQVVLTTRLRIPAYEPVLTGARSADQGGDRA